VSLNFYIFGGLIARLHTKNYKHMTGVLYGSVKFNNYILIAVFLYGAFPITAVYTSEYIISSSALKNNTIFIALTFSLVFSFVFIKLLHIYLTISTGVLSYKKIISDAGTVESVCFFIFLLMLIFTLLL
jgi:NADH:ubiquinone oxidoreductase subunit 4 (subunit M)